MTLSSGTKRLLITGATGAVGSQLVPRLVARGWEVVCVVRPKAGQTPAERLEHEFGPLGFHLSAVGGDIREPLMGLSSAEIAALEGRLDAVFHCAASVSFDSESGEDTRETNLGGTRNFLDLAERLGMKEVHLVSTAYVAGDSARFNESDFDAGEARNPYEASKREAEALVRERFPGAFTIYRPSVVVGDSVTGFSRAFDGYYGMAKAWHRLATFLARRDALPPGIERAGDRVHLPLIVRSRPGNTINLVPVDWVTDAMAQLLERPASGRCYHLTHPEPMSMADVTESSCEHLGLDGVRIASDDSDVAPGLQGFQRRLDAHLARYGSYLQGEPLFGHEALPLVLGAAYRPPPRMDRHSLGRMLEYAMAADWQPRPATLSDAPEFDDSQALSS